ncbi:MAG: DUF4363 family protein [Oscillospiraceae bacterium]|jgi:ferritin|nr:DUF4363 family protein [Oscillospiraceae bacterium]
MKRLILGIVIITLVFTLCLSTSIYIRKESKEMMTALTNAAEYLQKNDKASAYKEVDKVNDKWQKLEFITDTLLHNRSNAEICLSVSRLKPYLETDNDEVYAEIFACKELLKRTYEAELRL